RQHQLRRLAGRPLRLLTSEVVVAEEQRNEEQRLRQDEQHHPGRAPAHVPAQRTNHLCTRGAHGSTGSRSGQSQIATTSRPNTNAAAATQSALARPAAKNTVRPSARSNGVIVSVGTRDTPTGLAPSHVVLSVSRP